MRVAAGDIEALRHRALAGDVAALTALGKRLLSGDGVPCSPREAIARLEDAASRGGAEATAWLARFAAWGVLRPRSYSDALDGLRRAAELGYEPSRQELRLLARDAGDDWAALRRKVDLDAWTRAPDSRAGSEAPPIRIVEGFAAAAECAWLVERGRHGMHRAKVYRHDSPGHTVAETRTNAEAEFTVWYADIVLALLRERIAASVGADTRYFEVTKLLRYEPGQQFSLHADFQEPTTPALAREIELHGQRVATFLLYLNDDYAGGETDFPRAGFRYRGRRGDALWFSSVDGQGKPDYRSVHAGMPPKSGTKWLLSQWVRSLPVA
jgi:hypothetical protein